MPPWSATRRGRDPGRSRTGSRRAGAGATGELGLLVAVTDPMALILLRGQLAAAHEAGFDVTVLSSPGESATRMAAAEGVRHLTVPMARGMAPIRDARALVRLCRELAALAPDIVNASTPKAGLLVTVAAWLTRVPCRVHTLRGLRFETATGASRLALAAMTWLTCALSHRVICISPSLRERAVALGVVGADKAVVLGAGSSNGIDLDRFTATDLSRARARELRRRLGIGPGHPVLGFAGRIARDKGIVELATAWRELRPRYPDLHWIVVGPDDATDAIPAALRTGLAGDARVHFLGSLDHDDVVAAYLAMDVLALPTHREGFGNVLIEAAALERPAVATAVTGCVDAVVDGVTGTLVAARDAAGLARAIERYVADPGLRQAHGRAGRERAAALYDQRALWQRMHEEYLALAEAAGLATSPPRAYRANPV